MYPTQCIGEEPCPFQLRARAQGQDDPGKCPDCGESITPADRRALGLPDPPKA